jgi:Na+-transporting methylmalonyl-CoA/oxaloacetate decarboxylase gamma subunit
MTWLIALGIVGLGLVILVLAVLPVLRRLRGLERAMGKARASQEQAETVQLSLAHLQERMAALQEKADAVTGRLPRSGNGT